MKRFKKALALLMALSMVFSFDFTAFADETINETDEQTVATYDATQPSKPSDGTVSGSPFVKGTAGSNSYRIPAMITLSDGTLVAAADARWNTTYDGGCGDTIVARSSDNGVNWNYTFANYLGDNGNSYNGSSSTCFIDPALAVTSDDTIYMLVDLYPYGIALNGSGNTAPSTAVGFNSDGTLKLSADGSNYNYYLKDGKIYNSSNTAVSGYTVDGYFNVYSNGTYVSNLFFSDSPYKVVRTGYLYLTKSTDKGATWTEPTLISGVKTSSEQVCLVGPGRGTVLSDGTIVFPVYKYNGSSDSQRTGFIYSKDGVNWSRSDSNISWSSESAIVEVNASTLRVFYRNGNSKICYVDVTKNGNSYSWGSAITTSVGCNSNTQLSAIKVTEGGADYILVSNPGNVSNSSSGSARTNGQIVTFKADDMSVVKTTSVPSVHTSNSFMYSCMSQLSSGDVAILYEDQENSWGTGSNCYYQMSYKTFTLPDLGIETKEESGSDTITHEGTKVTVKSADGTYLTSITSTSATVSSIDKDYVAYDVVLNDGKFTGKATVTIKLSDELKTANALTGFVVENNAVTQITGSKSSDGNYYSFETPHFSVVGVMSLDESEPEQAYDVEVKLTVGEESSAYTVSSNTNYGSESKTTDDGIASYVQTGVAAQAGTTYTQASVNCSNIISSNSYSWKSTNYYYTPDNGTNYYVLYAKRTGSGNTRTFTWGYTTTGSTGNMTTIGSQTNASSQAPNITVYTKSGSGTATPASTTIKFTGVTAGTTYVTVGSTTYKVVVTPKTSEETVSAKVNVESKLTPSIPTGCSVSYEVTSGADKLTVAADGTFTPVSDGSATVVATVKAANGNATEVITYTVTITDRGGEDNVTVAVGEDKTLSVDLRTGETVEWTSADSSIAAIVGDDTAVATLIGSKTGSTTVTGTVKDAQGNVTATYTWNVTVTDSNTKSKYIYVNVSKIEHTTVYYSINGGELVKVNGTGVLLDEAVTGHYQLAFYAAPDEGYALTYMASTNSAGEYYCLSDGDPDGVDGSAWPFADGYDWEKNGISTTGGDSTVYNTKNGFRWGLAEGNITISQLRNVYARAIALGCDGTLVFTKNNAGTTYDYSSNGNNLHSDLTFVSQKLPSVEKTIKTIGGNTYVAGETKVKLGDEIVYTVTVTRPATNASYGTITYSNEALYDQMTNGNTTLMASGTMGTSTTSDKTYTYETKITLSLDNYDEIVKDGTITNTVDFQYSYKSQYSNGKLSSSANASADQITIDAPTYVVDFGLPMSFELDKSLFGDNVAADKITATALYGDVEIEEGSNNKYNVTYVFNKVMKSIDTVKFTVDKNGKSYVVLIYPATTVMYEPYSDTDEDGNNIGFLTLSGTWNKNVNSAGSSAGDVKQNTAVLGADTNNYGYDSVYANPIMEDASISSTTKGEYAEIEFKGTGIDLYINSNESTGRLVIQVRQDGVLKSLATVETKMAGDQKAGVTAGYGIPVYTVTDLPYGTYTVKVIHSNADEVTLDGFRVYNTLEDSSVYTKDLEDNPTFYDVRDLTLTTNPVTDFSEYGIGEDGHTVKAIGEQVYKNHTAEMDATSGNTYAIITATNANTAENQKDVYENGPKNEVYLASGASISFTVKTKREVQLGLKGVDSAASYSVSGGNASSGTVSTADMFYTIKDKGSSEAEQTITVTNTGATVLSVTKIKICDDPDAIQPLSVETVVNALKHSGFEDHKSDCSISLSNKTCIYTGKACKIGCAHVTGSNATVTYTYYADKACTKKLACAPTKPGTYYVVATVAEGEETNAATSNVAVLKITQASQKVLIKSCSCSVKASSCKKKSYTVALSPKSTSGKAVTCKKVSGSSKLTVSTTGKVTVKKGTKKGTYSCKIKCSVASSTCYKSCTTYKTIKVVVK